MQIKNQPVKYASSYWIENLELALENQPNILVQRANESYSDSTLARKKGEKEKAAIVIWGWYGVTNEASSLSVNFDIMDRFLKDYSFCPAAKGEPRLGTRGDLERYTIQTDLSNELSYLILFATGMANFVSGNHGDAINNLDRDIEITPDGFASWPKHNVYHLRGEIYHDLGEYRLAVNDYDKAIEIYDGDPELYFDRGEALWELENYEAVVADWSKYLAYKPDDVYVLFNLGSLNFNLGNYEEAIVDFEKGFALEPSTGCALIESGYSYYFTGAYDKAIDTFNYAIDTGGLAEGHFGRGIVFFFSQNEYEQAIVELTKSIEDARSAKTYFPAALEYRAYAYLSIGEKKKAINDLIQFLEIVRDPKQNYVWFYRDYEKQEIKKVEEKLRMLGVDPESF